MTRASIDFAREHVLDDTARLLLSASRYPGVDMPAAVQQIEGLRMAREKWPSLLEHDGYLYPPRLNREQASSEATARYKASLLPPGGRMADLTGGMGVDTLAFAEAAGHVDYVERDPMLCTLMEHNLEALGIDNVDVHCTDSMEWLTTLPSPLSALYIDPARRGAAGRRVSAFEDCTPNLLDALPLLRSRCSLLMVKASPMIDIHHAVEQLGTVSAVHIVAVHGECKEVLFLCGKSCDDLTVNCMELERTDGSNPRSLFSFTYGDERAATAQYSASVGRYLYAPHAALRKAGCFRLLGQRFGLPLLGPNTHLYTSPTLVTGFPGRTFEVLKQVAPDRKAIKQEIPDGKAHVVVRNFPAEADALQRQLGLREGGDLFLIATTLASRRTVLLCRLTG